MKKIPSVQPKINKINPYMPGMPVEALARERGLAPSSILKLASNENPFGMSQKVIDALRNPDSLHEASRYPSGFQLTESLARYYAIDANTIILGNGSNDILDLIARVYLSEGDEAISSQYGFSVYPLVTTITGAANVIAKAQNYGHDLAAMQKAITSRTKVIWIANPNNPTGTFLSKQELEAFLKNVPENIVVVLDEAYFEFVPQNERLDSLVLVKQYPNLIVTRTFSKAYGLAGLRVGYAIAEPAVVEVLNRVRQPFNVNTLALVAACQALDDQSFMAKTVANNQQEVTKLNRTLQEMNVDFIPSKANFIAVEVDQAAAVHQELLACGIIVRPLAPELPNHLRVSVGTPTENQRFLQELKRILKQN